MKKTSISFVLCLIASLGLVGCVQKTSSTAISSSADVSSSSELSSSTEASSSSTEASSSSASVASESSSESHSYDSYYSSISDSLTGGIKGTLISALATLIKPKAYYTYSGSGTGQLGYELEKFDEDPENSKNMYMFYTNISVTKQVSSAGLWNREHVWPQSLSGGLYGTTGGGADALHIRPTIMEANSTRGNLRFGNAPTGTVRSLTYGGVSYTYARTSGSYYEPSDAVKGDCARIILYMYTCYFSVKTPIVQLINVCESVARMVEWSKLDPVSPVEIHRNDVAQNSVQKNRNPFVDHPEWVDKIFA